MGLRQNFLNHFPPALKVCSGELLDVPVVDEPDSVRILLQVVKRDQQAKKGAEESAI